MQKTRKLSTTKIIAIILALVVCLGVIVFLSRPVSGTVRTGEVLPKLGKEPIYVELTDGVEYSATYTAPQDYQVQALKVLLVNTDVPAGAKVPTVDVRVTKAGTSEVLAQEIISLENIEAGSWNDISMGFDMEGGASYTFSFKPDGCDPYFMKVAGYEMGISVGFEVVTDSQVTYSEMFYYSLPLVILITALFVLYMIFGEALFSELARVLGSERFKIIWNIAFLVVLFAVISLKILKFGYVDGVYISADSDGYLREAVNLCSGNGFSYEGIAGYKSHFANWPIIYPAMIAGMMMITGANAYLASKFVAIFVMAVIFITLWFEFRERAWLYALAFTNVGFLTLCYYTWSEVPFEWFILMFALMLGRIVESDEPKIRHYVLLGVFGSAAFLTRYFGIFAWAVAGFYWLVLLVRFIRGKRAGARLQSCVGKLKGLFISAAASGVVCFLYLVMNKIKNGYPTGVSRGTWWDDYATLTDDLFKSLVVEVFNVFSLDVPSYIEGLTVAHKAMFVLGVVIILMLVVKSALGEKGIMSRGAVLVAMAVFYYVMFIMVRYRSSMDTFYFRFFVPATVLLVMGVLDLLVARGSGLEMPLRVLAALMSVITVVSFVDITGQALRWGDENTYFDIETAQWDEAYKEIPERSVIIWNDIDYRSSWYRPDVYTGDILTSDTWQDVSDRYSPSAYICMKREDAMAVIESGEYQDSLVEKLSWAIDNADPESKYIVTAN